jgi:hypothetical protein
MSDGDRQQRFRPSRLVQRNKIGANRRSTRWRHVKTHGDALQLRAGSRIKLHDAPIVAALRGGGA